MQDTSLNSPEEVRNLIRAGHASVRVGDYEAARTTFERAVVLDPTNVEARDGLLDVRRRLGVEAKIAPVEAVEYCYRHPDVETGLHCVQCGRPICFRCSTPAAVGQLCPDCRRGRRSVNYQLSPVTLIKGGGVALLVSAIASAFVGFIPLLFWFFIGPAIGEVVMRVVDWATKMKRGRPMQIVVAVGILVGAAITVLAGYAGPSINLLIFLVLSISIAVTRLR